MVTKNVRMNGISLRAAIVLLLFVPRLAFGQGLNDGLLLHYPLNGNADDSSGNNFNGTVTGAVAAADRFGTAGGALQFNGSARVEFPLAAALKPQPPLTLSCWVWFDELSSGNRIILTNDFLPDAFFGLTLGLDNANRLLVSLGGGLALNTFTGSTPLTRNRWHHVVVVVRSTEDVSFYLSGCEDPTSFDGPLPFPIIIYSPVGRGNLGRANAGIPPVVNSLRGRLDDVRYWNRALSEEDVLRLYDRFYTPTIELGADTMICLNETLTLTPQTTVSSWTWSDDSMGPTLEVSETGKYWVSAQTSDCQEISDTINVMVGFCDNCTPAVPNAFTPNGDNQNDTFRVLYDPAKCRIVDFHIMIFSRWGQKVYESNNADERWDGRNAGQDLPSDVYVVVVKYAYESEEGRIMRDLRADLALLR